MADFELKNLDFSQLGNINAICDPKCNSRPYGRRFWIVIKDPNTNALTYSSERTLNEIFKDIQQLSQKAQEPKDLRIIQDILIKLKNGDNEANIAYIHRDGWYHFRTWFHRIFDWTPHSKKIDKFYNKIQKINFQKTHDNVLPNFISKEKFLTPFDFNGKTPLTSFYQNKNFREKLKADNSFSINFRSYLNAIPIFSLDTRYSNKEQAAVNKIKEQIVETSINFISNFESISIDNIEEITLKINKNDILLDDVLINFLNRLVSDQIIGGWGTNRLDFFIIFPPIDLIKSEKTLASLGDTASYSYLVDGIIEKTHL